MDDIPITNWADLLLFEYHKLHDKTKGMAQIKALRLNHNDVSAQLRERWAGDGRNGSRPNMLGLCRVALTLLVMCLSFVHGDL